MKNLIYAARPIVSDMFSTLLFAALFALTNNIYLSTGCAIALGVGQVAYVKLRGKPVPGMQWASLGLVTVLGGATLMTGDPRFVMIKPTVIYLTIGAAMMQRGWMERYMPPVGRPYVPTRVIVAWGYVWASLMFTLTAACNLFIQPVAPGPSGLAPVRRRLPPRLEACAVRSQLSERPPRGLAQPPRRAGRPHGGPGPGGVMRSLTPLPRPVR